MKLLRVGPLGSERPAVLQDNHRVALLPNDCGDLTPENLSQIISRGSDLSTRTDAETVNLSEVTRIGAPLYNPGKIVCVGLNYADHAAEGGQDIPQQPILFMKAPDTIVGPHDSVVIPKGSKKTDWEVELGIVIGEESAYLESEVAASDHIAGYVLCNDVSERHFQLELGGQWDKGKNCPTFFPMGPYFVTADEFGDPCTKALGVDINGQAFQNSSTSEMIFNPAYLVWYISQFMTLKRGDIISSGTPAGVGAGQQPEVYLRDGDTMRSWADGLGEMRNQIKDL